MIQATHHRCRPSPWKPKRILASTRSPPRGGNRRWRNDGEKKSTVEGREATARTCRGNRTEPGGKAGLFLSAAEIRNPKYNYRSPPRPRCPPSCGREATPCRQPDA